MTGGPSTLRLWIEVAALFVGVPVLMLVLFGHYSPLLVVLGLAGVAAGLLAVTPGFRWSELWRLPPRRALWPSALFLAATAGGCLLTVLLFVPGQLLAFPLERTGLWLMVMVAYPLASALPQEIIYRPLFFRRYGRLFGGEGSHGALLANAVAFGLGHLFFQNPVTIVLSAAAGVAFGLAYQRTGSMLLALILHSVAGQIVFTSGLGVYFYHGAVGR